MKAQDGRLEMLFTRTKGAFWLLGVSRFLLKAFGGSLSSLLVAFVPRLVRSQIEGSQISTLEIESEIPRD